MLFLIVQVVTPSIVHTGQQLLSYYSYILLYMKGAKKLKKFVCGIFLPPMRGIHPGTQVQFNSTLMSLAPIKMVCPGTDLLGL